MSALASTQRLYNVSALAALEALAALPDGEMIVHLIAEAGYSPEDIAHVGYTCLDIVRVIEELWAPDDPRRVELLNTVGALVGVRFDAEGKAEASR